VTTADQFTPIVAALANGGHVVVWESGTVTSTGTTPDAVVRAQMFDANGQKVGGEITVFSGGAAMNGWKPSAVTGLPDGSFIVAASDAVLITLSVGGQIPEVRLYTQRVNASGQLVATGGASDSAVNGGLASRVASDTIDNVVAIDGQRFFVNEDGSYALLMFSTSRPTPSSYLQWKLQNFDAMGNPAGSPVVLSALGSMGFFPTTALLANGNILAAAVTIQPYAPIEWKIVTPGGQVIADQMIGAAPGNGVGNPAVAALADGTGVIVHSYADSMTTGWKAVHVDAGGSSLGVVILPLPTAATYVQVMGLTEGGYLVTWTPNGSNQVVGRYFTSAGQPAGEEFVIASGVTTPSGGRPVYWISAVPGGFVAAYQAVGDGQEIYEIRFTAPSLG
jgi:hypothetical protein